MILEKHISALLYQHDCIIVPGFGGFIAQKLNAQYLPESAEFFPPAKRLSFNPSLVKNDGLLIQELMHAEGFSYAMANEEIEKTVIFWKNHLQNNTVLNLEMLGEIKLDQFGNFHFHPESHNYLLDSFGLSKLKGQRILPVEIDKNKNLVWWKAASIIPVLLGGYLYFGQPKPVTDFVNEQWSGFVLPALQTHNSAEKAQFSLVKNAEKEAEENYNKKDFKIYDYQVIAGSFKLKSEAENLENTLQHQGFEYAKLTQKKGSYYYVAFKTFPTKELALEFRKNVQDEFPQTWVLSLKD